MLVGKAWSLSYSGAPERYSPPGLNLALLVNIRQGFTGCHDTQHKVTQEHKMLIRDIGIKGL
jgi:hypothetical protein